MAGTTFPDPETSTTGGLPDPFGRSWADVAEMIELRRDLAEAEIRNDLAAGKRLAVLGSFAVVLALTGLPLLLTSLAFQLAAVTSLGFAAWLAILGAPLLVVGVATGFFAWQRFRREFLALSTTRQELREDLLWLREWLSNSTAD